jgi:hypothetical protein
MRTKPPSQVNLQSETLSLSTMQLAWKRKSLSSFIPELPKGLEEISRSMITVVFRLSFKRDIPIVVISFFEMLSLVKS